LVDHLPWSSCVPAPDVALHHIIGAPGVLDHVAEINAYFRLLASKSPRVKVFTLGKSEEGREALVVAVSDEQNLAQLDHYKEITAKLADPRTLNDADAQKLITEGKPFYWALGSIHSPETGSPEMLMELAYRLAVEETPFIQNIRKNAIVLITPATEVDGRDRMVDLYTYHTHHREANPYPLVWWGHYVSHDNNRDNLGESLALSQYVMRGFLDYHPTVMHDLHESVPYLYIMTGTGPYNAWVDPILLGEWHEMAYYEIDELTKRGIIGVWTHGFFDGWGPNYMLSIAFNHNSLGRFYETFGNGGADTRERTLRPPDTSREWYRPNPPLPKVTWSARNNINMQESAILFGMSNVATNHERYLTNFYLKSRRAVAKGRTEGPAAWVLPADDPRPGQQADLLNLLKRQGVEVHRTTAEFHVGAYEPAPMRAPTPMGGGDARSAENRENAQGEPSARRTESATERPNGGPMRGAQAGPGAQREAGPPVRDTVIPAGSYVIRMDQPYSRLADQVLDTQYYNPRDPRSYDDTGWTLSALHNVRALRVLDTAILDKPMTKFGGEIRPPAAQGGSGPVLIVENNAENALATLRFRLANARLELAEAPFNAAGHSFRAGALIVRSDNATAQQAAKELGLSTYSAGDLQVRTHALTTPRIALMHDWRSTQQDGWFRMAMDKWKVPYTYIADTAIRETANLRDKFDVIIAPPMGGGFAAMVRGVPMRGNPMPWKNTPETPNLVAPGLDSTDDMRGGLGFSGVANLEKFVSQGGLLIAVTSSMALPVQGGMTEMVSVSEPTNLNAPGSVVLSSVEDLTSPIAYGYDSRLYLYYHGPTTMRVGFTGGGGPGGGGPGGPGTEGPTGRASGRGTLTDPDVIQGRPYQPPEPGPHRTTAEQELYIPDEMREAQGPLLPSAQEFPRVVVRFAPERDLMLSGMMEGAANVAEKPAVVDAPHGKGHVVLFANNPMWREQTQGTYMLVFNALMNWDHLDAGRKMPAQAPTAGEQ
ncbi:MAG TPA: M14 family zinc carboxypeptidase, partial [Terriglobales bacterium]|nr:M14 family zinc carboxypeptidase [Terriglobales bacterium]